MMDMTDFLKLENQMCFPIYALSRRITALYRPYLEKIGLTYPQYLVMLALWEHKTLCVKNMGEILYLDSGTLTPLLKRMETNGLLYRSRRSTDERMVDIMISEKGEKLSREAQSIPLGLKDQLKLDDDQLNKLREQLNKLLETASNCTL